MNAYDSKSPKGIIGKRFTFMNKNTTDYIRQRERSKYSNLRESMAANLEK